LGAGTVWSSQDPPPRIVISKWYVLLMGWMWLLVALLLLSFAVIKIVSGEPDAVFIVFVVPFVAGAGIWMAGFTTTITFNRDTGTMTVTRGHIPLFLWSLRACVKSRFKWV
jgi:hypothetical protein